MAPVTMNASCHPYVSVIHGTNNGATTAPTFDPALKIPVARARSFLGNHSATVLMAAGKLPASPNPRANLAAPKPKADRAKECAIAEKLQNTMARLYPILVPRRSITRPTTSSPIA